MDIVRASDRICLVCEKYFEGAQHCGVEVCRACAAFYKRTVQQKKTYVCRKGHNKCDLQTGRKESCQKCRLTKCMMVGLALYEKLADETQVLSCSVVFHNEATHITASTSMPAMRKFVYFYKNSISECANQENQYRCEKRCETKLNLKDVIHPLPHDHLPVVFAICKEIVRPFSKEILPVFNTLTRLEQDQFLVYCLVITWNLESAYRTMKLFNDPKSRKIMCGATMYLDEDQLQQHFDLSEANIDPMDRIILMEYVNTGILGLLRSTHTILQQMQLTDVEYIAAVALVLWDGSMFLFENMIPRKTFHNEAAQIIAEKERSNIYNELFYYYRNVLKMDNYIERIMILKELALHVQKNAIEMRKSVVCLNAFNYFAGKEYVYDALEKLPTE